MDMNGILIAGCPRCLAFGHLGEQTSGTVPLTVFFDLSHTPIHRAVVSCDEWVNLQLLPLPKIFSPNFPVKSHVKPLDAKKSP